MNNLSPLGLITCFIFSIVLNGVALPADNSITAQSSPYLTNQSNYTIYFKPESRKSNPGLDPNAAYPLGPGESYSLPFDAVVTNSVNHGKIYRLPTGSRLVIRPDGVPEPANIIARAGSLLPAYGVVSSPCVNFAKLANLKGTLYQLQDITITN